MKEKLNKFMDWFEERFNTIIDLVALIGASLMIVLAIVVFILLIVNSNVGLSAFEYIIPPGAIGFFAILMLFALRVTRHLTKKQQ